MDRLPPRSIIGPPGMASPIVAHIPHASTVIPSEVRARLLVSDEALARELIRMTDWHTDTLFAFTGRLGATRLVNGVSRLVVDPERFTDDARAYGFGAVLPKRFGISVSGRGERTRTRTSRLSGRSRGCGPLVKRGTRPTPRRRRPISSMRSTSGSSSPARRSSQRA